MEYIEPKPVEPKPHAKRNKIILASTISALVVAAISLTYYFVISKVFIEKQNVDLLTYSYRYDVPNSGVRIDGVKEGVKLPSTFRIPNKLDGRPVVEIAAEVFSTNSDIEEMIFPDSLEIIGASCFEDCENLKKFNIPASLKSVGTDAFNNTKWLNDHEDGEVAVGKMLYTYKGEMDYPSAIVASENSPEYDESKYETIINLGNYTEMSSGVFKDQIGLKYAEIPMTFTSIYESLFEGCTSLETVVLPETITTIENFAFSTCTSLSGFSIPKHISYIGNLAFAYTSLTGTVQLTDTLEYIGYGAFKGCKNINFVSFDYGISSISDSLFEDCENLVSVAFDEREYGAESRLSYIGENAFKNTGLFNFYVPFNVTSVKKNAFANCPILETIYTYNNLKGSPENIYTLNAETGEFEWVKSNDSYQGIQKFETGVFTNSTSFKAIVLMDETSTPTSDLDSVTIPVTVSSLGGTNEDSYFFTATSIETLDLRRDVSSITDKNYLNYLNDHQLTVIAPSLCANATYLENVYFAPSIITVNRAAFKNCMSLETVVIGENVVTIETGVFEDCTSLVNVTLPETCNAITTKMFANCTSLVTINIPENYKTIGQNAFAGCTKLVNVNFGSDPTLTNIGQLAFNNCTSLVSIVIPNSCDAIASEIFKGCVSLENITLSNHQTIDTVKTSMFEGCVSLATISLPENYKNIDKNAFKDCSLLKTITLKSDEVVSLNETSFDGVSLEHIYVPEDLVDDYKEDSMWSEYSSIIEKIA